MDRGSLIRKRRHLEKCEPYKLWQRNHPAPVPAGPSSPHRNQLLWENMSLTDEEMDRRAAVMAIASGGHLITLLDKAHNPKLVEYI